MKHFTVYFFIITSTMVVAPARAQVFEGLHTRTISTFTKSHLFIENRVAGVEHTPLSHNHARLIMLADLLTAGNAPPDLLSALKLAIQNAEITNQANDEIQIVQKDLRGKERAIFDTPVAVTDFNGNASDLLHSMKLADGTVELDKFFTIGEPIPDSAKLDCKLTAFSFKGTLRNLLKELAKKRDPLGGYVVMVGKDLKLSVKFIP